MIILPQSHLPPFSVLFKGFSESQLHQPSSPLNPDYSRANAPKNKHTPASTDWHNHFFEKLCFICSMLIIHIRHHFSYIYPQVWSTTLSKKHKRIKRLQSGFAMQPTPLGHVDLKFGNDSRSVSWNSLAKSAPEKNQYSLQARRDGPIKQAGSTSEISRIVMCW